MGISLDLNLTTVLTIAVTQTVSTITTFYVMKSLDMFHSHNKKHVVSEVKKQLDEALSKMENKQPEEKG